jgi:hypothetical protein
MRRHRPWRDVSSTREAEDNAGVGAEDDAEDSNTSSQSNSARSSLGPRRLSSVDDPSRRLSDVQSFCSPSPLSQPPASPPATSNAFDIEVRSVNRGGEECEVESALQASQRAAGQLSSLLFGSPGEEQL